MFKFLKKIFNRPSSGASATSSGKSQLGKLKASLKRMPSSTSGKGTKKSKIDLQKIAKHEKLFRRGLGILAIYLTAKLTAFVIGLFMTPKLLPPPTKRAPEIAKRASPADTGSLVQRNMFNVEGNVPDPFDQAMFDCLSQARPSGGKLQLLATIVMENPVHSVALVEEQGNPLKLGVRTEEVFFDGRYQALKIVRGKLCFLDKSSQELEFIESDVEKEGRKSTPVLTTSQGTGGIQPNSETDFQVEKGFLEDKLTNLQDVLQSARAVPYLEGGQFKGFLIQSLDPDSIFKQLGVNQGDVLSAVNDIVLDNAGKGLEAFQRLRNTDTITLKINRSGQPMTLNYKVR